MPASHHRVRNSACFEKPNLTKQTDTCNAISKYVNIHKYVEKMQRTSINNCGLLFHSILGRNCKLVSRWALQVPSPMVPQGNIVHTVSLAVSLTVSLKVSLKVSFTRSLSRFLSRFWTFVKLFDVPFFSHYRVDSIYIYMCVCLPSIYLYMNGRMKQTLHKAFHGIWFLYILNDSGICFWCMVPQGFSPVRATCKKTKPCWIFISIIYEK